MKRTVATTLFVLIGIVSCKSNRHPAQTDTRMSAATTLTDRYSHSALSRWDVRGRAAGTDCSVLYVETAIILEESMVEALHYGVGAYDVYTGGIQQFSRDRAFRGVAYRDSSGKVWTFGEVSPAEAGALVPCG